MFKHLLVLAIVFLFFLPLSVAGQTQTSQTIEEFLLVKIQLLQLQIELLKTQIAILLRNAQAQLAAPVYQTQNCAQLQVSWEWVSGATSYRLYRNGVLVYDGTSRTFFDSGLALGQKYKYVVYGVSQGKQGQPSEVREITAPNVCPPVTPTLRSKAEPCGGNITLNWYQSPTASIYQLFRSNREIYEGPLGAFVDSGLRQNTSYEYKIRAGNNGGWSDFSAPASFQSSPACAPQAPEVSFVIPESAREGVLLLEMTGFSADNVKVRLRLDDEGVTTLTTSVMAFSAKAQFSDITISRVDLFFESPIWLYLDKVSLSFGGRTIAEKEVTQDSLTRIGSEHIYQLRFDGFSAVIREDRTGTFTVRVDAEKTPPAPLPHNITVFLENNSIRGVDKAGIAHLVPLSGGGKDGVFSRTFIIEAD